MGCADLYRILAKVADSLSAGRGYMRCVPAEETGEVVREEGLLSKGSEV